MVNDQFGCPTSATDLAEAIKAILFAHLGSETSPAAIYHVVNDGEASWFELAKAVLARGVGACRLRPVSTAEYPTAARRPTDSRLATARFAQHFGAPLRPWREAVDEIVDALDASETPGDYDAGSGLVSTFR